MPAGEFQTVTHQQPLGPHVHAMNPPHANSKKLSHGSCSAFMVASSARVTLADRSDAGGLRDAGMIVAESEPPAKNAHDSAAPVVEATRAIHVVAQKETWRPALRDPLKGASRSCA